MKLVLNGHERAFDDLKADASLIELVTSLGLQADRVAVELNRSIIARAKWDATTLNDGDRLEVVHFVGGGS